MPAPLVAIKVMLLQAMLHYAAKEKIQLGTVGRRVCECVAHAFMEGVVRGMSPVEVGVVTKETEADVRRAVQVIRETPPGLIVNIVRKKTAAGSDEVWTLYVSNK
jgi:hypothetical protein